MTNSSMPVGVFDSGIGGFSVVRKMKELLPHEDIIYFGDNAHCPYGSRTKENIIELTQKIVDFFKEKNVKAIVIACNTTSTQSHMLDGHGIPIVEIIGPVCRSFENLDVSSVGIVATPLTTKTGAYEEKLKLAKPSVRTKGVAAPNLAYLIENSGFSSPLIEKELLNVVPELLNDGIRDIIFGCTHYPLAENTFKKLFPDVSFYDPAIFETKELMTILASLSLLNPKEEEGNLTLCTSGEASSALSALEKLNITQPIKTFENIIL